MPEYTANDSSCIARIVSLRSRCDHKQCLRLRRRCARSETGARLAWTKRCRAASV
ncbi:uncharacterized protein CC84DRAFT_321956 [Paraphaeosphaeria sporulosa]|uniref:Uncharacterized protein n=1 Tax=Paraphaeosphaeria sporulosa TaxID=1460663 RepID=A0A177BZ79_9PLEO|nr:uncharacterized protein CC84DRAFT_321956 [Paraphaeosphaeria sporulosa]OAG00693.1 hypothetical protein CC84DRAFT_321956 [Paraphaeosphaeria sporulosa]